MQAEHLQKPSSITKDNLHHRFPLSGDVPPPKNACVLRPFRIPFEFRVNLSETERKKGAFAELASWPLVWSISSKRNPLEFKQYVNQFHVQGHRPKSQTKLRWVPGRPTACQHGPDLRLRESLPLPIRMVASLPKENRKGDLSRPP